MYTSITLQAHFSLSKEQLSRLPQLYVPNAQAAHMDRDTSDSVVLTLVHKAHWLALATFGSEEQIAQQRDLRRTDAMKHSPAYYNTVGNLQAGGSCKYCTSTVANRTAQCTLCTASSASPACCRNANAAVYVAYAMCAGPCSTLHSLPTHSSGFFCSPLTDLSAARSCCYARAVLPRLKYGHPDMTQPRAADYRDSDDDFDSDNDSFDEYWCGHSNCPGCTTCCAPRPCTSGGCGSCEGCGYGSDEGYY
jgi:hypothetical protein